MQLLKRDSSFYPQGRQDSPRHPSMRDPNHDVIQIQSALAVAVTPVDDSHGNAVIAVGGGTITLADVHASALKASDFHFV